MNIKEPSPQLINIIITNFNAAKYALAEKQIKAFIENYPTHPFGWKLLGAIYKSNGKASDALLPMRKAVAFSPNDAEAHSNLGVTLSELGNLDEAVACYSEAIRLKPNFAEAYCNRGATFCLLGKLSDAEADYREAIRLKPNYVKAHNNLGNVLKDQGRYTEAEMSYRASMNYQANNPDTHNNLGVVLSNLGRFREAENFYRAAIQLRFNFPEAYTNLGVVLGKLDNLIEAELMHREAIRLKPDYAKAYCNLGAILIRLNRLDEAELIYQKAIYLKPDFIEAQNDLGNVLKRLGRLSEAELMYRKAIRLKPDYAKAYNNLGILLIDLERLHDAEPIFREAIRLDPFYAEGYNNYGVVLSELGRVREAEASYREAIRLTPGYADALNNLGNTLKEQGRLIEAEETYREALRLKPNYAELHTNLGVALNGLGRLIESEECFRKALNINPNYSEAQSNLGLTLVSLGRISEAEMCFREAMRLKPAAIDIKYKLSLLLPDIYNSNESIDSWRNYYESGLLNLLENQHKLKNPSKDTTTHTFHLAYHNKSNIQLMKLRSQLARKSVNACNYIAPHIDAWKAPKERKIRIAFCSQFFAGHTIGKLYHGIIKNINKSIFEVIIIYASNAKRDEFSNQIDAVADRVLQLNPLIENQNLQISNEKLDILFYPDIGMSPETFYLAHSRLAPVQIVSWGHPDTTGITTLDYFVSSSLIETDDADDEYSERLIKLSRLPAFYQPLISQAKMKRTDLGLPEKLTLYGCPQSLFKLHPDFDPLLAEIAEKDNNSRIIMLEGTSPAWSDLLRKRWLTSYPILNDRVAFFPRMPLDKFSALIANVDVLLDPVYFGSGNTLYESMAFGIPTITFPGQFMRGRIVSGAYKQMEIIDAPIANQKSDYAGIAVDVANNLDRKHHIQNQILSNAEYSFYSDSNALHELEEFFIAAVEAADRGEKIPIGWKSLRNKESKTK